MASLPYNFKNNLKLVSTDGTVSASYFSFSANIYKNASGVLVRIRIDSTHNNTLFTEQYSSGDYYEIRLRNPENGNFETVRLTYGDSGFKVYSKSVELDFIIPIKYKGWEINRFISRVFRAEYTENGSSFHYLVLRVPFNAAVDISVVTTVLLEQGWFNASPTIVLNSPSNNTTLYENDILNLSGTTNDTDPNQSVTAYYQIDDNPKLVLATNLSQMQIPLSKQLIFKGGRLFDGEVPITDVLADGVPHTLKVWAIDSEGGQSDTVERTFYVVPNRAPLLSVETPTPSGIIDTDKFTIRGTSGDPDA
ncbi:hypothetical protein CD31_00220, partial [Lysinibacillus boronitolerans JCM 21713 = 10a = NBRC 103108]